MASPRHKPRGKGIPLQRTAIVAIFALAAIAGPGLTSGRAQGTQDSDVIQAITRIEHDWGAAFLTKDVATIERIEAPQWMFTGPAGELQTKAQNSDDLKSGAYVCTANHLDHLDVRVYGDTAVAFGLETEKSTYKGEDSSGQYRFTDVFVKINGTWLAVASQLCKVAQH